MTHTRSLRRCVLLPIDGTEESLKPVPFLASLYLQRDVVHIILALIVPPIPPVYRERLTAPEERRRRLDFLHAREENIRTTMKRAREILETAGFPSEHILEHVQVKETSLGKQACLLAHIRKADAVMIPQRMSSRLEAYLRDDPAASFLQHCLTSPVWLTEGRIDPSAAAICLQRSAAARRAVDHAAFMLSPAVTNRIVLLYVSQTLQEIAQSPVEPLSDSLKAWMARDEEGALLEPVLRQSVTMLHHAGIENERLEIRILPARGRVAEDILKDCRKQGFGIVVVGHEGEDGFWNFLRDSVTHSLLAEVKDTALCIVQ